MKSLPVLLSLLLVSGCGLVTIGEPEDAGTGPAPSASSTPAPSATSTPGPDTTPAPDAPSQRAAGDSRTCEEVVAGINAFNQGDFQETVEHFELAVPLAEAEDDGSDEARLLIEAVRYYAELAPEDYPAASASSTEFERWKQVTLGQCVTGGSPSQPTTSLPVV